MQTNQSYNYWPGWDIIYKPAVGDAVLQTSFLTNYLIRSLNIFVNNLKNIPMPTLLLQGTWNFDKPSPRVCVLNLKLFWRSKNAQNIFEQPLKPRRKYKFIKFKLSALGLIKFFSFFFIWGQHWGGDPGMFDSKVIQKWRVLNNFQLFIDLE